MRLISNYVQPSGTYLLGQDRKGTHHGVFCWSAEQIAAYARDWRLNFKEETKLAKTFMAAEITVQSEEQPRVIHGVGAALIDYQFETLAHVRDLTDPRRPFPLKQGRIYFRTQARSRKENEAALLFYITPEGQATLAHVRTQDQAAELLRWEDWMQDDTNKDIVDRAIETLPEYDPFFQQSTLIHGELVQELIKAQLIYKSFFSTDPATCN